MDTGLYSLTEYQYKVEAQGPGGGSPAPESVNVLTDYGDGVVYRGSPFSAQSFDGVTASWEGEFDRQDPPLQNDSVSLTLDNLPNHYAMQVAFFGGAVNAGHTVSDSDTLTLTGLGSGDVRVFTGPEAFLWDLNVTADHVGNSITLTIEGTDFESGQVWWNPGYATDGWAIDGVEVKLLRYRFGVEVKPLAVGGTRDYDISVSRDPADARTTPLDLSLTAEIEGSSASLQGAISVEAGVGSMTLLGAVPGEAKIKLKEPTSGVSSKPTTIPVWKVSIKKTPPEKVAELRNHLKS